MGDVGVDGGSVFGLSENVVGVLCYLFLFVSGLFFYFLEEDSRFVRFHASQSTVVFGFIFVLFVFLSLLGILGGLPVLGFFVGFLVVLAQFLLGLVGFVLWVYLMFSAFQGEWTEVPYASFWVERYFKV